MAICRPKRKTMGNTRHALPAATATTAKAIAEKAEEEGEAAAAAPSGIDQTEEETYSSCRGCTAHDIINAFL